MDGSSKPQIGLGNGIRFHLYRIYITVHHEINFSFCVGTSPSDSQAPFGFYHFYSFALAYLIRRLHILGAFYLMKEVSQWSRILWISTRIAVSSADPDVFRFSSSSTTTDTVDYHALQPAATQQCIITILPLCMISMQACAKNINSVFRIELSECGGRYAERSSSYLDRPAT